MWPTRSLESNLVIALCAVVFTLAVTMYGWVYGEFLSAEGKMQEWAVDGQARHLAAYITDDGTGPKVRLPEEAATIYHGPAATARYILADEDGRIFDSAGWEPNRPPRFAKRIEGRIYDYVPNGDDVVGFVGTMARLTLAGRTFWLQAEQVRRDRYVLVRALVDDFMEDGGWIPIPIFLALLGFGVYWIRRTLAPLERLSDSADRIGPADVSMRLAEGDTPTEVLALVRAINRGLDRLQSALNLQREFTADAAHELRTPLAVVMAQVERMPDRVAAAPVLRDLEGIARMVQQLLRVAQLEALALVPDGKVDLAAVAIEIASYLAPLAIDNDREIAVEGAETPSLVTGNHGAIHHALRNLVENALVHTAPRTSVIIRVSRWELEVSDHGPGIPEALRPEIFKRFWRADHSGTRGGAGLGLSIVEKVMQLHGGRIIVGDAPGGGASFRLQFRQEL